MLNNSTTKELDFNVVQGLEPLFMDVTCSPNPAKTYTVFRIIHDRIDCEMNVKLEMYDISGRHVWTHEEKGVSSDNTYTINWNLAIDGGARLGTGLYLFRMSISSEGSSYTSKTKKLIIPTNQ